MFIHIRALVRVPRLSILNLFSTWERVIDVPGAFSAGDTPVPIPNTTVKTRCGDDTPLGESSTVPDYIKTTRKGGFYRYVRYVGLSYGVSESCS